MKVIIREDPYQLGVQAGRMAGKIIRQVIQEKDSANIILATGTSQFETLNQLALEDIDWSKVIMFHLDEYIGLPETSPASFRKYLKERFTQKVGPLKEINWVNGEEDPVKECRRLGENIEKAPIDLALVGIGENGHLGFNDPPADFETSESFIVVDLDERCRKQQFGEGWFKIIEEVPRRAITMSIKQIMKSSQIVCSVPDNRKAEAVRNCFENGVSNLFPASILQTHANCVCLLDKYSSALLNSHRGEMEWTQTMN